MRCKTNPIHRCGADRINRSRILTVALTAAFLAAPIGPARAEEPAPDLIEILSNADAATLMVKAVQYDVEYFGTGEVANRAPRVQARVLARQGRRGMFSKPVKKPSYDVPNSYRFTGSYVAPGDVETSFDMATDGESVVSIDESRKQYISGDLSAMSLIQPLMPLFMLEFFHPTPFHDELTSRTQKYEGIQDVSGIPCHVIYVVYDRPNLDARWYFSVDDYLPRRVDRIQFHRGEAIGARVLVVKNLDATPAFPSNSFKPLAPPGYERCAFNPARDSKAPRQGGKAPDFLLKSPDGETVHLAGLRGNVVVLDFWSSWCVPCKLSMPKIQSIHERYRDQPVKVFGLNCWDPTGDPAKLMRDRQCTYGLLVDADAVAREYGVDSIPAVFVIDAEGNIRFSQAGVVSSFEDKIDKAIRDALNDRPDSEPQP